MKLVLFVRNVLKMVIMKDINLGKRNQVVDVVIVVIGKLGRRKDFVKGTRGNFRRYKLRKGKWRKFRK
jgi:hypothetical protein